MINDNHIRIMIDSGYSEDRIDKYGYNQLQKVQKLWSCCLRLHKTVCFQVRETIEDLRRV